MEEVGEEQLKVENSAEVYGDLQVAVNHPLHNHEKGHAERVNVEQYEEVYGHPELAVNDDGHVRGGELEPPEHDQADGHLHSQVDGGHVRGGELELPDHDQADGLGIGVHVEQVGGTQFGPPPDIHQLHSQVGPPPDDQLLLHIY